MGMTQSLQDNQSYNFEQSNVATMQKTMQQQMISDRSVNMHQYNQPREKE